MVDEFCYGCYFFKGFLLVNLYFIVGWISIEFVVGVGCMWFEVQYIVSFCGCIDDQDCVGFFVGV